MTLQYATADATQTRASQNLNQGTFASGETVKVLIRNTGESHWESYDFITSEAGVMRPAGTVPYYPDGSQNIDIVAYYPASAEWGFDIQTDQTTDAAYKASDLMFAIASNQAKQSQAVELAFDHKMAKINVNVTAGDGVSAIRSVAILNVKTTVTITFTAAALGPAAGSGNNIIMNNNGSAIIPSQTLSGNLLSIETDKGTAIYSIAGDIHFARGYEYTFDITVRLRNVGITNKIEKWWITGGTHFAYPTRPELAGHKYVDMGEGLLWATTNLAASAPHEYGHLYSWAGLYQKDSYELGNSLGYVSQYGWYFDYTSNNESTLADRDYGDDAARHHWGSVWRIPLEEEWAALLNTDNYSWEWVSDARRKGMLVTRLNGPCAGNNIFLPAAGFAESDQRLDKETKGYYWSSTAGDRVYHDLDASALLFPDARIERKRRYHGCSIRPVASLSDL